MTLIHRRGLFVLGAAATGALAMPNILRAQTRSVADTLAGDSRFKQFLDLITRASMVEDFRQPGPITVFAPIDQAFFGAPANMIQDLTGRNMEGGENRNEVERQRLSALINYHVVPGTFLSTQLTGQEHRLKTLNGASLGIQTAGSSLRLQNPAPAMQLGGFGAAGAQVSAVPAEVVQADIMASNGVIHAISQVLWP